MTFQSDKFPPGWLPAPMRPGFLSSFHGLHLQSWVGQGGMGMVFKAICDEDFWEDVDETTQEHCMGFAGIEPGQRSTVAVKILKPEVQGIRMARRHFEKEARVMSKLLHPNVLPVIAMGEAGELAYFVTPFIEHGSLASSLDSDQLLPAVQVRDLVLQIASGLSFCHSRDVLHRDVKPSNILSDDQGRWLICDFGLARTSFSDSFMDPQRMFPKGTAAYLSPGMALGESEHQQGDVYSLGAVLYELLVGEAPYVGPNSSVILQSIQSKPPQRIREREPDADPVLSAIAERAMARVPEDRYVSMQEIIDDLELWGTERAREILKRPNPRRWSFSDSKLFRARKYIRSAVQNQYFQTASLLFFGGLLLWGIHGSTQYRLSPVKEISNPLISNWSDVRHGNWRLTMNEEELFLYDPEDRVLQIFNQQGNKLSSHKFINQPRRYELERLVDLNGDGQVETVFARVDEDHTVGFDIYNQHHHLIKRFTTQGAAYTDGKSEPYWNTTRFVLIDDVDDDFGLEALITVNSGFEKQPRKLVCFDVNSGKEKWSYETGPWIDGVSFSRDPSSGMGFITATGQSLSNGAIGPDGLQDDEPYLYLFDGDGKLIWSRNLTPPNRDSALQSYAVSELNDFNADGELEALVLSYKAFFHQDDPGFGRFCLYDLDGNLKQDYSLGSSSDHRYASGDASPDHPGQEVAVIDHSGIFHLLDSQLQLISKRQLYSISDDGSSHVMSTVLPPADLDGDGTLEWSAVICHQKFESEVRYGAKGEAPNEYSRHDFRIVVLNAKGSVLVDQRIDTAWNDKIRTPILAQLADLDSSGRLNILYPGEKIKILELQRGLGAWIRSWPVWELFSDSPPRSEDLHTQYIERESIALD